MRRSRGIATCGALAVTLLLTAGCASKASPTERDAPLGLGTTALPATIAAADMDVGIDGAGLPPGRGTAAEGDRLFTVRCAACHTHGTGLGRIRTQWPYATTLFDYIRRAMPPERVQRLSADDAYALTAFVLAASDITAPGDVIDAATLPRVAMPAKAAFQTADGKPLP